MSNINIIFLDIDGVLNTERFIKYQVENHESDYYLADYNFDPICMNNLKSLIDETNALIVLSSSWRLNNKLIDIILGNFKQYGIDKGILDITPLLHTTRGLEINHWLNKQSCKDINYVILDDEDFDIKDSNLVKCNPYYGFTKNELNQALNILKGDM